MFRILKLPSQNHYQPTTSTNHPHPFVIRSILLFIMRKLPFGTNTNNLHHHRDLLHLHHLLLPSFSSLITVLLLCSVTVFACAPPGFIPSQDPAFASARCSDLILYPINAVDQSDQYRFDYSDVGFGNTHSQAATVTITCTTGGQPATVEGFDQQRSSITSSPALIATCTNVGGSQYTWTIHTRILQFVDCRV